MLYCLLLIAPQPGWAAGTSAGVTISNTATVSYDIGGAAQPPITSAPAAFMVDELIKPVLTWQDAAPVAVSTPGINDVLTFLLTNAGNGTEAFGLSRTNGPLPLPGGNYTPLNGTIGTIFFESNATPGFQPTDTAYVPGTNDPNLAPDAGQLIYVISDTPAVAANIQGEVRLAATSLTAGAAGAATGTGLAGSGQGGGFAVVGTSNGQVGGIGSYITSGLSLAVTKTASVLDPQGGSVAMPGSVMTYQVAVALSGTGTAANLVITDPLPADISYVTGSISVDGTAMTDASGDDIAQFFANTISVSLGNVAAPANFVVTFRATIN